MPAQGTSDLTLNLLDLMTGEEQVVTPLLSEDYPNNFVEAEERLNDPDVTAQSLYDAFISGITEAVAWSPDGRYLAFAGQMDGLSSDLYVYDVNERTIRRLSSGDQEMQWIEWSPDGKWILHSSVFSVGMGMTFDIYAASLESSSIPYLSTNIMYDGVESWLNSHQYIENDGENGPGNYGLRLVDIDTGKIIRLWDGSFLSYGFEPDGKWLIVNAVSADSSPKSYTGDDPNFSPGPYLINLETLEKTKIEFPSNVNSLDYAVIPFDLGDQIFILMGGRSDSYFLSENLDLTPLELQHAEISVSPDREYWAAVTDREAKIFSADNTLITSSALPLPNSFVGDVTWRPDSSGLFLVSETYILSMDVPAGDIKVIETDLINDNYNLAYRWIGNQ
jgi:WD40 repeat protein